jgi:hypothetical protein
VNLANPFALIEQVTITFNGAGYASGDEFTQVVTPVPPTWALVLSALACLAIGTWARRRKLSVA